MSKLIPSDGKLFKRTSEEKASRKTHNPGIYPLVMTPPSAIGDVCQAAEALQPFGESNMASCTKNMPNNDNQSQKKTKAPQTPRWLRPKSVWSHRAAGMCDEKDNDCAFSIEEGDPCLMIGQSSTPKLKATKVSSVLRNQQLLGSRRIGED